LALEDWPWDVNFLLAAIILALAWLTQPSADQRTRRAPRRPAGRHDRRRADEGTRSAP
jgi:hypothetical protein